MSQTVRTRTFLGRGPFGILVRSLLVGLGLLILTMLGVTLHALWLGEVRPAIHPSGVIIVLGGTMAWDGTLGRDTEMRTRAGVTLYKQGIAPRIHFTGGVAAEGKDGPGTQMKDLAVSLGVPESATSVENLSESTLQNAMFSKPVLGPLAEGPVVLVSDGYHLGRSWASFRWAGYGPTQLYTESSFGLLPWDEKAWRVLREALSWYFNPVRIAIWEIAGIVGVPDDERIKLLD